MKAKFVVCPALFLLTTSATFAQSVAGLGALSGSVHDATGAAVPGANVVVSNDSKGIRRALQTSEAGVFNATITLPENEVLATSPLIKSEAKLDGGWKRVELEQFVGRDYPVLCSTRFKEFTHDIKLASGKTVKNHLASIYAKLDARDRTQAVLSAVRIGIIRLN